MDIKCNMLVNEAALEVAIIEIKLHVNLKLYQKGVLTEEMYTKAKELILKSSGALHTPIANQRIKRMN